MTFVLCIISTVNRATVTEIHLNQEILAWGVPILKAFEHTRNPVLDVVFIFFHHLGNEAGYLIVTSILMWLRRDIAAFKLLFGLVLCIFLNLVLKDWVQEPRPFAVGAVSNVIGAQGYSFPSGHAQLAGFFYTGIALLYRRPWLTVVSIIAVLGICLCRVYLGVHYPHDVIGGVGLGGGIATALYWRKSTVSTTDWPFRYWLAGVLPIVMIAILPEFEMLKVAGLAVGVLTAFKPNQLPAPRGTRTGIMIALGLLIEAALFIALYVMADRLAGPALGILLFGGYAALGAWVMQAPSVLVRWTRIDVD